MSGAIVLNPCPVCGHGVPEKKFLHAAGCRMAEVVEAVAKDLGLSKMAVEVTIRAVIEGRAVCPSVADFSIVASALQVSLRESGVVP